jgi:antitoxin component YwqK of YwqJK toxin-antitoxin module
MKNLLPILFFFSCFVLFGQTGIPQIKRDTCYKKSLARKGQRFTEWECGKLAGVVDCNEKLELADPSSDVVLSTGSHKPFTGTCETCHNNGILQRRVRFVNGFTDGMDTTTYISGCTEVIRSHIQGKPNGHWTYFEDSTGFPLWEKTYVMGELNGVQINYVSRKTKLDTLKLETYKMGVLNGPKITFSRGIRAKEVHYTNGLMNGPFIEYNKEGKVIQEIYYKEGKKHGVFSYYYDDGTLLRTENWNMDVKSGEFKTFYYDQSIQEIENYKKGLKEGWFEQRFPDGKLKSRAHYEKDVLVEEHVYDKDGREIKTFGGTASSGKEDDAMPGKKKKKKKAKPTN